MWGGKITLEADSQFSAQSPKEIIYTLQKTFSTRVDIRKSVLTKPAKNFSLTVRKKDEDFNNLQKIVRPNRSSGVGSQV